MREVIVINPNAAPLHDKIRTAAYCRVSSDSDEQLASFSTQVSEYTARINKNPDWTMVDIYADEGISGVSAAKRPEFQRMMADCRRKKIDRILTKSISRFARNVKECIEYIRELQSLGVSVEFEKEGIDTAFLSGEMMIAVFGSLAQEESKSISSNMSQSYEMRMKKGEFVTCHAPFGYRLNRCSLTIDDREAKTVRYIFSSYINGMSTREIADALNSQQIGNHGNVWRSRNISIILRNEKYVGDAHNRKNQDRYKDDAFGIRPPKAEYYIENSHPAIIDRSTFEKAAAVLLRRRTSSTGQRKKNSSMLAGRMQCEICESTMRRKVTRSGHVSWSCQRHDQKKENCELLPISDSAVVNAAQQMIVLLSAMYKTILLPMEAQLNQLRNIKLSHDISLTEQNKEIANISGQLHLLSRLKSKDLIDDESYLSQTGELKRKLMYLQEQRQITIHEQQQDNALEQTQMIIEALQSISELPAAAEEDEVFETIVDKVIIGKDRSISFRLINGLKLEGFHG
jgi:site-specific DNA recombinase